MLSINKKLILFVASLILIIGVSAIDHNFSKVHAVGPGTPTTYSLSHCCGTDGSQTAEFYVSANGGQGAIDWEFDWGDGDSETGSATDGERIRLASHTFPSVPDTVIYNAQACATGDAGQASCHHMNIQVTGGGGPSGQCVATGPECCNTMDDDHQNGTDFPADQNCSDKNDTYEGDPTPYFDITITTNKQDARWVAIVRNGSPIYNTDFSFVRSYSQGGETWYVYKDSEINGMGNVTAHPIGVPDGWTYTSDPAGGQTYDGNPHNSNLQWVFDYIDISPSANWVDLRVNGGNYRNAANALVAPPGADVNFTWTSQNMNDCASSDGAGSPHWTKAHRPVQSPDGGVTITLPNTVGQTYRYHVSCQNDFVSADDDVYITTGQPSPISVTLPPGSCAAGPYTATIAWTTGIPNGGSGFEVDVDDTPGFTSFHTKHAAASPTDTTGMHGPYPQTTETLSLVPNVSYTARVWNNQGSRDAAPRSAAWIMPLCPPPNTHFACRNNMCTSVPEVGTDQCATDVECQTHAACNAQNQCVIVAGAGADTCSTNADCPGAATHLACSNNQCVTVAGAGTNTCNTNADCGGGASTHFACNAQNQCVAVAGAGTDDCSACSGNNNSLCRMTASPDRLVVPPPKASTLTWNCDAPITDCTIDNGVGAVNPSGSTQVSPSSTTSYTLTCNGGGATANVGVGIHVFEFVGGALKEILPK
jgi:hypothetical protein